MDSRVFVKNLPVDCTEDMLKYHFQECGTITDARIQHTKSGKSRQFGFVGFLDSESKDNALKLDKSFIKTSQIRVSQAYEKNSANIPRPWSRHTKGTSANYRMAKHQEEKRERKTKEKLKRIEKEKKRKEQYDKYLEMNKTRPIWDNDISVPEVAIPEQKEAKKKAPKGKKKEKVDYESDIEIELVEPTNIIPDEAEGNKQASGLSDLDYLLSKTVDDKKPKKVKKPIIEKPEMEEGRLFIRNLAFSCTEEDLNTLFGKYGDLSEVYLPVDKQSKRKTGIGFVTFVIPSNAEKAKADLSGKFFQGRYIHIMDARGKRGVVRESHFSHVKSSFKRKQMVQRKQSAGSAFNWNTMYVRQDTALQKISKQLGVKKSDILDVSQKNLPVRVALAETEAIRQTKDELGRLGIDFDQVDRPEHTKVRSRTLILVKNLPDCDSIQEDLTRMFRKYGQVNRVVLPEIGTMAVVEFGHASEARTAFDNLAYKKYQNVPLYLEWAPMVKDLDEEEDVEKKRRVMEAEEEEEEEENQMATLFVKNLSPSVSENDLKSLFSRCGEVVKVKIMKVKSQSGGYGFVTFRRINDSVNAFKRFQNFALQGKELQIQYKESRDESSKKKKKGRRFLKKKLIVKNLAFEANKKDLQELFGAFGDVREIRIPRKVSGGHRGFAFIEFSSAQDCTNARKALSNTHLYGRSLVLEHALEDNSVEAIRENMRKEFRKKRKREKVVEKTNRFKRRKMRR